MRYDDDDDCARALAVATVRMMAVVRIAAPRAGVYPSQSADRSIACEAVRAAAEHDRPPSPPLRKHFLRYEGRVIRQQRMSDGAAIPVIRDDIVVFDMTLR